ncbi:N-acetylmuramoyl-L-alanine amidase [Bradyrhizobium sp. Ai1a-2]|uniref:N-acetylmuramoyl-L-alanine amidase n=1 Tax=Bradyrhizobium sp. Ai1a-2 TaxID=196490 RepID=UPI0003F9ADC3|nr:N-acetylmuramoyl-L-alanine amidase [Bradyrhizobium sp. Ai1a-2]
MRVVGEITVDGRPVGRILLGEVGEVDTSSDLVGYDPEGRADSSMGDGGRGSAPSHGRGPRHGGGHHGRPHHQRTHHAPKRDRAPEKREDKQGPPRRDRAGGEGDTDPRNDPPKPKFSGGEGDEIASPSHKEESKPVAKGPRVRRGSAEVEGEIEAAAKRHHVDPNTMKAIASIESDMNPSANANKSTKYKGLYQFSPEEWKRFGSGNIYSAHDNAEAMGRKIEADRADFKKRFGREPTDEDLYMIHQQGMGHFTRGALTNVHGNPYPGMHGPQTAESFREGWGNELARRKAHFENPGAASAPQANNSAPAATSPGALKAPNGQAPAGFIVHHTGDHLSTSQLENVWNNERGRHFGTQYHVDRDGNLHVLDGRGQHIKNSWGSVVGNSLNNRNVVGVEVAAKNDKDVTEKQLETVRRLVEEQYPNTPVYGHGEVNPGHREADEGMKIVNRIRADRAAKSETFGEAMK